MFANIIPIIEAMRRPEFELDTGEAAVLLSAFDTARANGYPFCPFAVALVDVLRRQLIQSEDGEHDVSVDDGEEKDTADYEPDIDYFGDGFLDGTYIDSRRLMGSTHRRIINRIPHGAIGANLAGARKVVA